jgi:glycosyltransferase involved in cell wall biosynthesis
MKINLLFITPTHSHGGGTESSLTNLVNHLDPEKYRVDIVEIRHDFVREEPLRAGVTLLPPFNTCRHRLLKGAIEHLIVKRPTEIKALFRLYHYDVVIAWSDGFSAYCLRGFEGAARIAWCHHWDDGLESRHLEAWSAADKIVAVSNGTLRDITRIFPALTQKTLVLHNGCDIERARALAEAEISLPFKKNIIAAAGRLEARKNYGLLIRAVSRVKRSGVECALVICGRDGEGEEGKSEGARLRELAESEGIADAVFFAGFVENQYPLFKAAKIIAVSALLEGWGMTVVEGMALGKPFVTTPVAGASDELADGGNCGLVADWDVESYAACLKKLLTDEALYEKMSKRCLEKVKEFSVEAASRNFDALITEVLPRGASKKQDNPLRGSAVRAVFAFAWAFAVVKTTPVASAFKRLRKNFSPSACAKLAYRLGAALLATVGFPLMFAAGAAWGIVFYHRKEGLIMLLLKRVLKKLYKMFIYKTPLDIMLGVARGEIIDTKKLDKEIAAFFANQVQEINIFSQKKIEQKTLISLTTFPARIGYLKFTLFSLIKQSIRPEGIAVFLSGEEFPDKARVLEQFSAFSPFGVRFEFVKKNFRSYKKLVHALREYHDYTLVTADDDVFYRADWLCLLTETARAHPGEIIGQRVKSVALFENDVAPYHKWKWSKKEVSPFNFATGCGGILYPPGSLDKDAANSALFLELCPHADDVWFYVMAFLRGTSVRKVANGHDSIQEFDYVYKRIYKKVPQLLKINVDRNENDTQLRAALEHYGIYREFVERLKAE